MDRFTDLEVSAAQLNAAGQQAHTHSNKATLDKFGETAGQPTFAGSPITGERGEQGLPGLPGLPGPQGPPGSGDGSIVYQLANRVYSGIDLTVRFASEISAPPFNGNVWAWIQSRIRAANWEGLNVGDFIPLECSNGVRLNMDIAGINTYFRYGDTAVPNHIDFISRGTWPENIPWNLADYNNGLGANPGGNTQEERLSPWLASNVKAFLNSETAWVPNGTSADPPVTFADYRTTGVWDKLPAALQAVIAEKRALMPIRYTGGGLILLGDHSTRWGNLGKLWLPYEVEVVGSVINGNIHAAYGLIQYPIFANNMNRLKNIENSASRTNWWLANTTANTSTTAISISGNGSLTNTATTFSSGIRTPVCFRIT
jgi:hypothetical protein